MSDHNQTSMGQENQSKRALDRERALERIFVYQAVEYGYLTQDQLIECIAEQESSTKSVALLTLCKQKGYLTESQVRHLMSKRSVFKFSALEGREEKKAPPKEPASIPDLGEISTATAAPIEPGAERIIEEKNRQIDREQKQREFLQRKLDELELRSQSWEKEKESLLVAVRSHQDLNWEQRVKDLEKKLDEKQQKYQGLFKLVEQSGQELQESEDLKLKAEAELQKKSKEIEFLMEKLEKEAKEKNRIKKELEDAEENTRKMSRHLEDLKQDDKGKAETAKQDSQPSSPTPSQGGMTAQLTQMLQEKESLEHKLKDREVDLSKEIEKARQEKNVVDQEKSRLEEELHKLRVSLETDVLQYRQKSEQLESKLQQYQKSLGDMEEWERQKKTLQQQMEEEHNKLREAEKIQWQLKSKVDMLHKEMEAYRKTKYEGELNSGTTLIGSGGETYVIQKILGRGGMGITYSALRGSDQNIVVVKTLLPEGLSDMKVMMRFVQEARTIMTFKHENLVQGFDVYQGSDFCYFAMEFLDGQSVEAILEEQPFMDPFKATEIILGIAKGLAYMEAHHLVHRDVKPANILLHKKNIPKLVDFGIVKMTDRTCALTTEGIILGTPYYLSPEQTYQTNVDIRSDIYSLGATYYHMVVGEVPFPGDNPIDVIQQRLRSTPKANKVKSDLHKDVSNVIEKMMNCKKEKRQRSAAELVSELEAVLKKLKK